MKKTFKILICLLLLFLIGVNVYLGRLFLVAQDENNNLHNEIDNINEKIVEIDKSIENLNNTYNNLSNDENNKDLLLEYTNWCHHKEKLEKIMDY